MKSFKGVGWRIQCDLGEKDNAAYWVLTLGDKKDMRYCICALLMMKRRRGGGIL